MSLLIFLLLTYNSNVQALEWAYWFVVNDGKVFEVKEEEMISPSDLGELIGKVETQADDYTGDYYGDASNYYKNGTRYFEITDVPIEDAIAVETGPKKYVKAIYKHDVPIEKQFNIFNVNLWIIFGIVFFILLFIVVLISKQK
jgi:hypothetical protein